MYLYMHIDENVVIRTVNLARKAKHPSKIPNKHWRTKSSQWDRDLERKRENSEQIFVCVYSLFFLKIFVETRHHNEHTHRLRKKKGFFLDLQIIEVYT